VDATLTTTTPGITILTPTVNFGDISQGTESVGNFQISADVGMNFSWRVEFKLEITAMGYSRNIYFWIDQFYTGSGPATTESNVPAVVGDIDNDNILEIIFVDASGINSINADDGSLQ
jgi:hypothetical protein